ncbi:CDP-diacylglycerol--glycerol-3-phosphate 3-phosphatidyltransferase [Mycobacterium tuberculosis]|nr:CDP-diacylglycerol--glycerol-3-phosphate 3-phosphatidyltransferase [Mycobacterium tuberculosis]
MSRSTRYSVAVSAQPETGQIAGRARIANLANILTLLRLVMVPVFLLALFYGGGPPPPAPRGGGGEPINPRVLAD